MRERWTIEVELDVDTPSASWPHVDGQPLSSVSNSEEGILDAMLDGLHWHRYMTCDVQLPWRVVKREPLAP